MSTDLSLLNGTDYTMAGVEGRLSNSGMYFLGVEGGGSNTELHVGYRGVDRFTQAQYGNDITINVNGFTSFKVHSFLATLDQSVGRELFYDGVSVALRNDTDPLDDPNQLERGEIGRARVSNEFDGVVFEILIYTRDIGDADTAVVSSTLGGIYGISP